MSFEVPRTTAEDIVGCTDATLQKHIGVDEGLISDFLDIPLDNARNALHMAAQLGLIEIDGVSKYISTYPYAIYLVTSELQHKAAILRLVLEQYPPYKYFKIRLEITGSASEAARQVRALYSMASHRGDIFSTLVSLGTYTNSLLAEGAGRYRTAQNEQLDYLLVVEETIQNRESAELYIRKRLGNETAEWINNQEVLDPLVTAYQSAALAIHDPRGSIVHAGNAIESFLAQVADHYGVNVQSAHGINSKADRIAQAGHLTNKHKFMVKYLGHVRNAADHGTDPEIGQAWSISKNTAREYVYVAQSVMSNIVAHINGQFII